MGKVSARVIENREYTKVKVCVVDKRTHKKGRRVGDSVLARGSHETRDEKRGKRVDAKRKSEDADRERERRVETELRTETE